MHIFFHVTLAVHPIQCRHCIIFTPLRTLSCHHICNKTTKFTQQLLVKTPYIWIAPQAYRVWRLFSINPLSPQICFNTFYFPTLSKLSALTTTSSLTFQCSPNSWVIITSHRTCGAWKHAWNSNKLYQRCVRIFLSFIKVSSPTDVAEQVDEARQ